MGTLRAILLIVICMICQNEDSKNSSQARSTVRPSALDKTSLIVLGNLQDGGSPHIGCNKECCRELFIDPDINRKVVSLGLVDPENKKKYLIEATPDMPEQMKILKGYGPSNTGEVPDGIFLTHAHIGHYTGLMYLGKEALDADKVAVFAMPRMKKILEGNGPWSQLVSTQNILIREMSDGRPEDLTSNLKVIPFKVPHRDEYSETVGYTIIDPKKKALFIPDIDKWGKWGKNIKTEIANVDYAFFDATFFDADEMKNRDISDIPHPFVIESMSLFANLSPKEKSKIYFIHLNHTNPLLNPESQQTKLVLKHGFNVARIYDVFDL